MLVLAFGCSSAGKKLRLGTYRMKYHAYGMFGTTIELKADSTFVKNFRGDMMNDNSYGKWLIVKDTLVLSFDTINYPISRYREQEKYYIKGKRLVWPNMLVAEFKRRGIWDTLSPKYKSMVEKYKDKTMIDFKGTMRKNYYKLIE